MTSRKIRHQVIGEKKEEKLDHENHRNKRILVGCYRPECQEVSGWFEPARS